MIKATDKQLTKTSRNIGIARFKTGTKKSNRSLLGTRMKELDREFNRQSRQLAEMAKKLKGKITDRL